MQIQCTWTPELRFRPSTFLKFSKHLKTSIGSLRKREPNFVVATMSTSTTADNQVASNQNGSTQDSSPPLQVCVCVYFFF